MRAIMMPVRFCQQRLAALWRDRSGIPANQVSVILPILLVLFFGVVEFSQGVAVDRKITIVARTLSDLVSQNTSIVDAQFTTYYQAGTKIMDPYPSGQLHQTVSELWVDPNSLSAKVQWSQG